MARPRFDPKAGFEAARDFLYNGVNYAAGDPFPTDGIAPHRVRTLYLSRAVNQVDASKSQPVQMRETSKGRFEITAPWLDDPVKVQGKAKAEKALAELREAGEPLDHHGVAIVGDGEGGWYEVKAEWSDEPLKVQGMDEARKEAARLRSEGPPPEHYAQVTVEASGDEEHEEGPYTVDAPWLENAETYETREEADARAQLIREVGPPADGYDADAIQKARQDRADAEAEAAEKLQAEQAEASRKAAYSDSFTITTTAVGDKTTYTLNGAGLPEEGEAFDAEDAATARMTELRDAGPPEGWAAPAPAEPDGDDGKE